jgi:anti-sigma factor RsiW
VGKDTGRFHISNLALSRFVDGELDEYDRMRVSDHLRCCVYCRSTVAAYTKLNGQMDAVGQRELDVPYAVTSRLMTTIDSRPTGLLYRLSRISRSVPAAAGSLSVALLLIIGVSYMHHGSKSSAASQSPTATASASATGTTTVSHEVMGNRLRGLTRGQRAGTGPASLPSSASLVALHAATPAVPE